MTSRFASYIFCVANVFASYGFARARVTIVYVPPLQRIRTCVRSAHFHFFCHRHKPLDPRRPLVASEFVASFLGKRSPTARSQLCHRPALRSAWEMMTWTDRRVEIFRDNASKNVASDLCELSGHFLFHSSFFPKVKSCLISIGCYSEHCSANLSLEGKGVFSPEALALSWNVQNISALFSESSPR